MTPKLAWGKMIKKFLIKIRQRVSMINSIKIYDRTSPFLRKNFAFNLCTALIHMAIYISPTLYESFHVSHDRQQREAAETKSSDFAQFRIV